MNLGALTATERRQSGYPGQFDTAEPNEHPGVQLFETDDFTEWRRLISNSFVPLQAEEGPGTFVGSIRSVCTNGVQACSLHTGASKVLRTPKLASRDEQAFYKLSLQLSGAALVVQDGREALLRPGDFTVYDSTRPYTIASDAPYRALVLMFPRDMLELPVGQVAKITGTRIRGQLGIGRVISSFLHGIATDLSALHGPGGTRLVHNLVDLVTTALTEHVESPPLDTEGNHRALATRARAFIEANLGERSLSPEDVANAHFVSTRHLQNVFREEGTTVAAWIKSRRLERCRRELTDPVHSARSISAIAARWGFLDAAHFSRAFKASYGQSPSEYRASCS